MLIVEFGHWPVWDARGFGGRPLVGNPQAGMFYPPVWLAWWLRTPAALGWLTVAHLLWGGLGTLRPRPRRWAWDDGRRRSPAAVYQASPFLLAQTFEGHYPHVWAVCWYPLGVLGVWQHRSGGAVAGVVLLPPILALTFLTGHPQEWLLLVLALSIWAAADAFASLRQGRTGIVPGAAKLLGWAGVLTLGIGPGRGRTDPRLSRDSLGPEGRRRESLATIPKNYEVHPINAFQLLSPDALGGPADYFGDDNYWESLCSFGLIPLVLIATAAVGLSTSIESPRLARCWSCFSLWFAGGRQLGLFGLLYRVSRGWAGSGSPHDPSSWPRSGPPCWRASGSRAWKPGWPAGTGGGASPACWEGSAS